MRAGPALAILLLPSVAGAGPLSIQSWARMRAQAEVPGDAMLLTAILGQESSLCVDKHRIDPLSYGCGQLRVPTARMFSPKVTAHQLMHDDALNIHISALYLEYCLRNTDSWLRAVVAYHRGLPTAQRMTEAEVFRDPYLLAIEERMK